MAKRGRYNLGLLSMAVLVAGAAALGACGTEDDSAGSGGGASGAGGGGGASGKGGSAGSGSAGKAGAGGAFSAGGPGGGSPGAGAPGAGAPSGGMSPGGAGGADDGGADDGGMTGDAGGPPLALVHPSSEVKKLSPLPAIPADTTNAFADNAAAATLGQKLFFDKRYSGPLKAAGPLGAIGDTGKVACVTCHAGPAMSDNRDPFNVTLGTDFHTRNAPAIVNSSYYAWTNWGGRFAAQWELPLAVAENPLTMNSNRLKLAHFIYNTYKAEYNAVFTTTPLDEALSPTAADKARFPDAGKPKAAAADADGPWEAMAAGDRAIVNRIIVNFGKAIQAYMRKLVSRDAPFDKYVLNDGGTISDSAARGAELFVSAKTKCATCHSGPFLSDNKFHNLGVRQDNTVQHEPASDDGRFKDGAALFLSTINVNSDYSDDKTTMRLANLTSPMPDATKAQFRTASLREVAETGPYMHSGQLKTLKDVVDFYMAGGGTAATGTTKDALLAPFTLSSDEQKDLIEFLKALSGAAVPSQLVTDTSGQ